MKSDIFEKDEMKKNQRKLFLLIDVKYQTDAGNRDQSEPHYEIEREVIGLQKKIRTFSDKISDSKKIMDALSNNMSIVQQQLGEYFLSFSSI